MILLVRMRCRVLLYCICACLNSRFLIVRMRSDSNREDSILSLRNAKLASSFLSVVSISCRLFFWLTSIFSRLASSVSRFCFKSRIILLTCDGSS
ncbi:MAG: hypothetical protein BWY72_02564 [Bacteroidetes bacterium ADurb.Bin416]|nr:MAG: hypothetical protein BWY72_02564 [Bacteroidetes bacterium ADurb.Bin416]